MMTEGSCWQERTGQFCWLAGCELGGICELRLQYFVMVKTIVIVMCVVWCLHWLMGLKILLVMGAILACLIGLIYANQNKALYIPVIPAAPQSPSENPPGWRHPSEQRCPCESVEVKALDGVTLRGWLVRSEASERLIVYFHENAGNLGIRIRYLKAIHEYTNSDVLIVAYRGFSDSEGVPTEHGLQLDSEAILDWAIAYKNRQLLQGRLLKIFLLGRSLGGAVSLFLAAKESYRKEIAGLVLENTFTNIKDMVGVLMPLLTPLTFLQTNYWPSITRIVLVHQPILFIRSLQDEIVPTEQMVRLMDAAINAEFKAEFQIPNGMHNEAWQLNPQAYFDQVNNFLYQVESK